MLNRAEPHLKLLLLIHPLRFFGLLRGSPFFAQITSQVWICSLARGGVGRQRSDGVGIVIHIEHEVPTAMMLAAGLIATVHATNVELAEEPLPFGRLFWIAFGQAFVVRLLSLRLLGLNGVMRIYRDDGSVHTLPFLAVDFFHRFRFDFRPRFASKHGAGVMVIAASRAAAFISSECHCYSLRIFLRTDTA